MSESLLRCESCGASFEQPKDAQVSSSKILCPPCAAERRARLRAAKSGGAPAAAPPAGAAPQRPAAAAPAARVHEQPAVAAASAPARARAPERAAAGAGRHGGAQHAPHHPEIHHIDAHKLREQQESKTSRMGWIVTGGLAAITGIVLLFVMSKNTERRTQREEYEQRLANFKNDILKVDLENEQQLKAAKDRVAKERSLWRGTPIEADVTAHVSRINTSLNMIIKTRSLVEKLNAIETRLQGSPTTATLGELFAMVRDAELKQQAAEAGGKLQAQLTDDAKRVRTLYVDALRKDVGAVSQPTSGTEMALHGTLEDTLRTVVEEAQMANDVDTATSYGTIYKDLVKQVNATVMQVFDQEHQNRVPWTDLLAASAEWVPVTSPSFTFNFGAKGLTMNNTADTGATTGGLSYAPGAGWRDYVIDIEFRLDSGSMVFYTRVADKMDSKMVPAFTAGTKNPNVLVEYGKSYAAIVSIIGNQLTVMIDGQLVYSDDVKLSMSRKGYPAVAVQAGTILTITRFKAKHLR